MATHRVTVNFSNCDHWHWSLNGGADSMVMTGNSADITAPEGTNTLTVKGVNAQHAILVTDTHTFEYQTEAPLVDTTSNGAGIGISNRMGGRSRNTNPGAVKKAARWYQIFREQVNGYFYWKDHGSMGADPMFNLESLVPSGRTNIGAPTGGITRIKGHFAVTGYEVTWSNFFPANGLKINGSNPGFDFNDIKPLMGLSSEYSDDIDGNMHVYDMTEAPATVNGKSNAFELSGLTSTFSGNNVQLHGTGIEICSSRCRELAGDDTSEEWDACTGTDFRLTECNIAFADPYSGVKQLAAYVPRGGIVPNGRFGQIPNTLKPVYNDMYGPNFKIQFGLRVYSTHYWSADKVMTDVGLPNNFTYNGTTVDLARIKNAGGNRKISYGSQNMIGRDGIVFYEEGGQTFDITATFKNAGSGSPHFNKNVKFTPNPAPSYPASKSFSSTRTVCDDSDDGGYCEDITSTSSVSVVMIVREAAFTTG